MAYDLPISLQKMLYMEETYRTNSFLFKNKKEGLINFRTVSYILGILVLDVEDDENEYHFPFTIGNTGEYADLFNQFCLGNINKYRYWWSDDTCW